MPETDKKTIVQDLVRRGEAAYSSLPKLATLPRGKDAITASFIVSDPSMSDAATQLGLTADTIITMINGETWDGLKLKPIDAALLAPAFTPEHQQRIAAALEQAQRAFWESQRFYLDEMAGPQAGAIPNVFMRDTLLSVEDRAFAFLRQKLADGGDSPIIWIDYAAGPASFVNGALHRLRREGLDLQRLRIILVEPSRPFLEYARNQPILRELLSQQHLFPVEGILEDRETYEKVEAILQTLHAHKADLITQAFGASYVADHLRPAMWNALFGTGHADSLKMVIAPTTKYNPSRMIFDRLKDEVKKRKTRGGGAIPMYFQAFGSWVGAFARPVPVDHGAKTSPALVALIKYGQGIKKYCPIRLSGEGFKQEIEQATALKVKDITPVLDEQAILISL